jgi:hypothetical protein
MNDPDLSWLTMHYERELGIIDRGWSDKDQSHGVQVVSFRNQPEKGVTTFATLGLSRHLLNQPSGRNIRQELLISAKEKHDEATLAKLLLALAERILADHKAVLRGDVTEPDLRGTDDWSTAAIYVTNPSAFEALFKNQAGPDASIVFAYLVPVTNNETSLIEKRGWRWFESQLEAQHPDIWDLARVQEIAEREI